MTDRDPAASETKVADATDVQALRDLADGWREVSRRNRHDKNRLLRDDDPGPHTTAIQLEWAAREIERLRSERTRSRGADEC